MGMDSLHDKSAALDQTDTISSEKSGHRYTGNQRNR